MVKNISFDDLFCNMIHNIGPTWWQIQYSVSMICQFLIIYSIRSNWTKKGLFPCPLCLKECMLWLNFLICFIKLLFLDSHSINFWHNGNTKGFLSPSPQNIWHLIPFCLIYLLQKEPLSLNFQRLGNSTVIFFQFEFK